jgi:hypothetical protein
MIIFGHSLGGNMIASALKDQMIELIRHHEPGTKLKSPIGDLIVLLNPASEANNWTMLQRTTKQRGNPQSAEGDALYPIDQPPIYVSLSAAAIWPAGGLRETDIRLMREIEKRDPKYDPKMTDCDVIHKRYEEYNDRADYDWATHDLFPAFRGDFRPAAETLDRLKDSCMEGPHLTTRPPMASVMAVVAAFLRNIPFMNTDFEQTRTIGQLDPFRPPFGVYNSGLPHAATQVGTTHELSINLPKRHAETDRIKPRDAIEDTVYGNAADPYLSECDIVDHWLWKARARQQVRFPLGKPWSKGDFWDSGYSTTDLQDYIVSGDQCQPNLTPVRQRAIWAAGHVESQFRHGLQKAGMDPIISANDPFWNIRAVDNGLHAHSGYVSYPLICAIHQLVMDDVASKPSDQYTIEKDCRERLLPGIGNDEADRK